MAQDSLRIWVRILIEQHGSFVVEDRIRKTAQKGGVYMRESSVPWIWGERSKKRPSFTFLKLPLAKNLEILEKREKWKEGKYWPGGRRHCDPGKAAWLLVTTSCPCPAHPLRCTSLGTLDSVALTVLPFRTLHPGAESRLKIESELFRKGVSAQAFAPCPAQWGLDSDYVLQVLF